MVEWVCLPLRMNTARELTLTISKGEQLFMDQLMENQLDIPKTEYRFLKKRRFRFDFAWPDRMIAMEVEGGVWMKGGGGHTTGKGYTRDLEKYNLATLHGWEVYRFTTQDVTKEIAIAFMKNIIINKIIMEESYEDISRGLVFADHLHSSKHEGKDK